MKSQSTTTNDYSRWDFLEINGTGISVPEIPHLAIARRELDRQLNFVFILIGDQGYATSIA